MNREAAFTRLLTLVGYDDPKRGPQLRAEIKDVMLRLRAAIANEPELVVGVAPAGYLVWPEPPPPPTDTVVEAPIEPEESSLVRRTIYRDAKTGHMLSEAVAKTLPEDTWVKEVITVRKARTHGQEG